MIAQTVTDGAEREPGGGKGRRQFDRLHQNIGGTGKIAFLCEIERHV